MQSDAVESQDRTPETRAVEAMRAATEQMPAGCDDVLSLQTRLVVSTAATQTLSHELRNRDRMVVAEAGLVRREDAVAQGKLDIQRREAETTRRANANADKERLLRQLQEQQEQLLQQSQDRLRLVCELITEKQRAATERYQDLEKATEMMDDHLHRQQEDADQAQSLEREIANLRRQEATARQQTAEALAGLDTARRAASDFWTSIQGSVLMSTDLRSMYNCNLNLPGAKSKMLGCTFSVLTRVTGAETTLPSGQTVTVGVLCSNALETGKCIDNPQRHTMDTTGVAQSMKAQTKQYFGPSAPKALVLVLDPFKLANQSKAKKYALSLSLGRNGAAMPTTLCGCVSDLCVGCKSRALSISLSPFLVRFLSLSPEHARARAHTHTHTYNTHLNGIPWTLPG